MQYPYIMASAPSPADTVVLHGDMRTLRAFSIAAKADAWTPLSNGSFGVPSEREPQLIYTVTSHSCTCPDAERGNCCKHRLAVAIHLAIRSCIE